MSCEVESTACQSPISQTVGNFSCSTSSCIGSRTLSRILRRLYYISRRDNSIFRGHCFSCSVIGDCKEEEDRGALGISRTKGSITLSTCARPSVGLGSFVIFILPLQKQRSLNPRSLRASVCIVFSLVIPQRICFSTSAVWFFFLWRWETRIRSHPRCSYIRIRNFSIITGTRVMILF